MSVSAKVYTLTSLWLLPVHRSVELIGPCGFQSQYCVYESDKPESHLLYKKAMHDNSEGLSCS